MSARHTVTTPGDPRPRGAGVPEADRWRRFPVYRVELVATVEVAAWPGEAEAQEVAGRLLAGIDGDGWTIPLEGPGSWAPEVKRITLVDAGELADPEAEAARAQEEADEQTP